MTIATGNASVSSGVGTTGFSAPLSNEIYARTACRSPAGPDSATDAPAQFPDFRAAEFSEPGNDGVQLKDRPKFALAKS